KRDSRTQPRASTAGGGPSGTADNELVPSARLVKELRVRSERVEEPGRGDPIGPFALLREFVPVETDAVSDGLGWAGREGGRYRAAPPAEFRPPTTTHHLLFQFARPLEELGLVYEGVKRYVPPPAGAISLLRAGTPARWRSSHDRFFPQGLD